MKERERHPSDSCLIDITGADRSRWKWINVQSSLSFEISNMWFLHLKLTRPLMYICVLHMETSVMPQIYFCSIRMILYAYSNNEIFCGDNEICQLFPQSFISTIMWCLCYPMASTLSQSPLSSQQIHSLFQLGKKYVFMTKYFKY